MAIDILGCYSTPPKPREYVLPGLIPGTVGSIIAPGGQSKSMLALMLAHCVASGVDLLGIHENHRVHRGHAVYLSAEDGTDMLHERLHAIGSLLDRKQREDCAESLVIEDLTKHTPDLNDPRWAQAVERLAVGSRLLFLDTLRSFHSGDENDATKMSLLVGSIRALAARTGCAVVFLHHSSKALAVSGQGDLQQAARGSSVLTDNVRWQAFLAGMTPEEAKTYGADPKERSWFVRFGISKQNYGSPFEEVWFRRGDGGLLRPVHMEKVNKKVNKIKRGEHEV